MCSSGLLSDSCWEMNGCAMVAGGVGASDDRDVAAGCGCGGGSRSLVVM